MKCSIIKKIAEHENPDSFGLKRRAVLKRHLKECSHCRAKYQKNVIFGMIINVPYQKYKLRKNQNIIISFIAMFTIFILIAGAGILCYIHYSGIKGTLAEGNMNQSIDKAKSMDNDRHDILTINSEDTNKGDSK